MPSSSNSGKVGFAAANRLHAVRVKGENRPGAAAELLNRLAKAGLDIRGFSGAPMGKRYIAYIALDTAAAPAQGVELLAAD